MKFNGISASPGVCHGAAFVLDDPSNTSIEEMQAGSILIVRYATPDYYDFFTKAGAIITEIGGRTCHAANHARELGIPCVVAVENILANAVTGSIVKVDGDEGVVYIDRIR